MSTSIGHLAEEAVSKHLTANGFEILDKNWRTKLCEIDIIAKKNSVIYFTEVKYRSNEKQGDGLEYITPQKLSQMRFAANLWTQYNNWEGDFRLLAVAVNGDGQNFEITEKVEVD